MGLRRLRRLMPPLGWFGGALAGAALLAAAHAQEATPPDGGPDLSAPSLSSGPAQPTPQQAPPDNKSTASTPAASAQPAPSQAAVAPKGTTNILPTKGDALVLYNQGLQALRIRNYKQAHDKFDASLADQPGIAAVYSERGSAAMGMGDNAAAVADMTRALAIAGAGDVPFRAHVLANRGVAFTNLKSFDKAVDDFDGAIAGNPLMDYAFLNRGLANYHRKRLDAAVSDLSQAIALNPKSEFAYMVRAYTYLAKKVYDLAAVDFQRILALSPENQGAILGLRQAVMAGKTAEDPARIKLVRLAGTACEPACPEWIAIEGKIEQGSAEAFKSVVETIGKRRPVVFVDSGGGAVEDALEIGRLIRKLALDVVVTRTEFVPCARDDRECKKNTNDDRVLGRPHAAGAICASACGFLIAAGVHRYVGPSGLVGVHQMTSFQTRQQVYRQFEVRKAWRNGRLVEIDRRVISETRGAKTTVQTRVGDETYVRVRKFFTEMGIDDTIMGLMISAPPKGMHWMTEPELRVTGIMTDAVNGEQLISRGVVAHVSRDGAAAQPGDLAAARSTGSAPLVTPSADGQAVGAATALTRAIQAQLRRIGCGAGNRDGSNDDGKWGPQVTRAMKRYNALTGKALSTAVPAPETLAALTARSGLVCPPACPPDLTEIDGKCAKVTGAKADAAPTDKPRIRTATTQPIDHSHTADQRPGNHCPNHQSTCSAALSSCLALCRERGDAGPCQSDCNSAVTMCRSTGVWKTGGCLKLGMAH